MTPDQAHNLAARYHNTWRGGPTKAELAHHLTDLDFDTACGALSRLARNHDHPPTIRQLIIEANGNDPAPHLPQPEDTGPIISPDDAYRLNPELNAWRQQPHPSRR